MARSPDFSAEILNVIAAQVQTRMHYVNNSSKVAGASYDIGETFDIWRLDSTLAQPRRGRMSQFARHTGRWHHQIRENRRGAHFARSLTNGPRVQDWQLVGMSSSKLASAIQSAIDWIDANVTEDDAIAHILIVPHHHLHLFWLESKDGDQIILIDGPPSSNLRINTVYNCYQLFTKLSKTIRAQGVPKSYLKLR